MLSKSWTDDFLLTALSYFLLTETTKPLLFRHNILCSNFSPFSVAFLKNIRSPLRQKEVRVQVLTYSLALWFPEGLCDWCTFFSIAFCLHIFTCSSHKSFFLSSSQCNLGLPILIKCPNHSILLFLSLLQDQRIYVTPSVLACFWFPNPLLSYWLYIFKKIAISCIFTITILLSQGPYFRSTHHNCFNIGSCPTWTKVFTMFILTYSINLFVFAGIGLSQWLSWWLFSNVPGWRSGQRWQGIGESNRTVTRACYFNLSTRRVLL